METRDERRARLQAVRARRQAVYVGPSESDADRIAYSLREKGFGARIVRRTVKAMACDVDVWVVVRIDAATGMRKTRS